ncbi:MAG: GEVED domain-containing protein [Chitinophagales bacterium]
MRTILPNLRKMAALGTFLLACAGLSKAQYCIPDYITGTVEGDYIDGLELGDISNFTGPGDDYNDYTDLSTLLTPGLTYDLYLYNTPDWTETYAAWIDWNQDEEYTDDERLNATDLAIAEGGSDVINFTVPFTALPGATHMRVMCVYFPAGAIDPCATGIYSFGEAEEYTINIPAAGPYDLGVTDIEDLSSGCGLGVMPLTVTITNLGTEPSGDFQVAYQVDHPVFGLLPLVIEDYTGPVIPSLTSTLFTFAAPVDLTVNGDYMVTAYTIYGVDGVAADDTSDQFLTSIPTVSSYPYYEAFEDGAAGWAEGGTNSSWELGDPVGYAIIGPPPATPGSLNSWTTNLEGDYNLNEHSYVVSPCFDFSSLVLPFMEFDINYDIQLYDDGAKLQYSTDDGDTWSDLGGIGTGDNWYNHMYCYAMWPDFYIDNYNGWAGQSFGWLHAYHDLTFLAGEPSVRFRFVFGSSSYWNFNDGFAFDNMWIGDPYPNDVGIVAFDAPESGPSLTASEGVTVVIENFGTLSQSGFPVSYQKDGGTVHTEIFTGTVDPGMTAMHTFTTTEDLSVMGDYLFTAWTGLATDEDLTNDTLHKIVSNLPPISGTNAYYIYSNVTGAEPWYTTSTDGFMDEVFGVGEWSTTYFETCDPLEIFSTATCFVYLEGSDSHADELEAFLNANMTAIENWVASGGHLLINAAPNEGDGMSFGFDGVDLNYPWYTGTVNAVDPGHPIWSGPFTPLATSMTGGSYGHATVDCADCTNILVDAYDASRYVLAEKYWGAGLVLFGGMTMTDFHSPALEAANFKRDVLSYLAICTISDNDVGVQNIYTPATGCGLEFETVSIKVRNFGFLPQYDVPVYYQADGGAVVAEVVPGMIDVGESVDYTFSTPVDVTALGEHAIVAWTGLPLDTILTNDSSDVLITNVPVISSFPYIENWESGDASGWTHYGALDGWALGDPDGPVINTPPTTTPGSQYSWVTHLTDYYSDNENNYLESPCLDMSSLILPYVQFDIWWNTEDYWDGAQLQYSTDGGVTWTQCGDVGTGDNWYIDDVYALGGLNGWNSAGPGWVTAHQDVSFLAGETDVKFRFHFASDVSIYYDGIAIDNFKVQDPFPNDIGVIDLVTPVSGVDLTATEPVTVEVRNFGTLAQTGFPVSFVADAGTVVTETFTGTLDPGAISTFTFTGTADLSAEGLHEICAWTSLATDEDITNDSIPGCKDIMHFVPIEGTGAYYIYSSTVGYEPGWMLSNSESMNDVFGIDAWTLDYYEGLDIPSVFNENNCFIFLEASESHWNEFETFFNNNEDWIEGWVASGGNLFINAAPWEGDGGNVGFGGVSVIYPWYTYYSEATDPAHPIVNGPFTPVTADLYGFYIGYARTEGGGINPIINDIYCTDCYILSEKEWGDGRVVFGNMGAPEYYTPAEEAQNLRRNIIDYLKLCSPVDIGVTAILSPEFGCGMTASETVTVEITNFGPTTVTNIPVKYQLDLGPITSAIAPGPLAVGGTITYSFTVPVDVAATGTHTLDVWTDFSGDEDETNDLFELVDASLATPVIEFGPNMTVCDEVTLDAGNVGSTYLWSTGATTQTISVTTSGTYSVTITNPTTGCTATDNITITVNYTPSASFTYTATGLTVSFTNTSTAGASYSWSFGDGGTSTSESPSHAYATSGSYTVTLTVTNGCGSDFYSFVIEVGNAIEDAPFGDAVSVYPNPTSGQTVVHIEWTEATETDLELVNNIGQIVWSAHAGIIDNANMEIDLSRFADGVYQLRVTAAGITGTMQIVLTK